MTRRQIGIIAAAFFIGAAGSIFFNRLALPYLSTIPGLGWVQKLQSTSPIVITRREEVRLNEGVNLIELTKQAQTFTVSIYSAKDRLLLGTGVAVTSDGVILTSKEALGSVTDLLVVTDSGTAYPASIRALDPKTAVAVLTISARDLAVVQFAESSLMQTAQRVFVLGKTTQPFTRQLASGFITKTLTNQTQPERVLSSDVFEETITTDADLEQDYIGGPVVNLQGRVVGIVADAAGRILPAEAVESAMRSYLEQGKITRAFYGIRYQAVSKSTAQIMGISQGGALVAGVEESSPARRAGLAAGDLIVEANGQKVEDSSFERILSGSGGNAVRLVLVRSGEQRELNFQPEVR